MQGLHALHHSIFPNSQTAPHAAGQPPDFTEPIQQVHLLRATFVHPKSFSRPMGLQPEPKSWPSHPRGTCGHWRGSRAVLVPVVAAVAVALRVLLLCVVLLSIPLKLPHGSASRGRFVALPPPSPQLVPFPGSPFPHHSQEPRHSCLLLQIELDPGFPLNELPRTVILGVGFELAGFRSFLGGETACWSQGEVKGPYSFPSRNKGGWKECGVWDLLLLLGGSKGDKGKDLWGDAVLGHSSRGCLRDSVALQMDFSVPVPAPAAANAKKLQGKNPLRGSPSFC